MSHDSSSNVSRDKTYRETSIPTSWSSASLVEHSFLEREVKGSNLGPVELDTVLPIACHRSNISSIGASCVAWPR